jgi:hypothetical protein
MPRLDATSASSVAVEEVRLGSISIGARGRGIGMGVDVGTAGEVVGSGALAAAGAIACAETGRGGPVSSPSGTVAASRSSGELVRLGEGSGPPRSQRAT